MSETRKYIELTMIKGIGPKTARALLANKSIDNIVVGNDLERSENVDNIISMCNELEIIIVTLSDDNYPNRLKYLDDAPIVLYAIGDTDLLNYDKTIGIVGARRCSNWGKNQAIEIAKEANQNNTVIVSGMAKGVDSYAHTSAIINSGKTIAVLGHGLDICYPKEHYELMQRIKKEGLLLSEYPPKISPSRYSFVRRNRIISALSDMLYVVDVGRNSGTESTVEYAKKYHKEVVRITANENY